MLALLHKDWDTNKYLYVYTYVCSCELNRNITWWSYIKCFIQATVFVISFGQEYIQSVSTDSDKPYQMFHQHLKLFLQVSDRQN